MNLILTIHHKGTEATARKFQSRSDAIKYWETYAKEKTSPASETVFIFQDDDIQVSAYGEKGSITPIDAFNIGNGKLSKII